MEVRVEVVVKELELMMILEELSNLLAKNGLESTDGAAAKIRPM